MTDAATVSLGAALGFVIGLRGSAWCRRRAHALRRARSDRSQKPWHCCTGSFELIVISQDPDAWAVQKTAQESALAWRRALERAGLPRIRFHDLRHTAATLVLSRGIHPKIASEMLGHSSVAFTMDTYAHVTPTMQREAVAELDAVMSGRL